MITRIRHELITISGVYLQPRCKGIPDVASVKKCELRPDPEDSCCKVMFCPDPKAMDDLKPVTLPFDGCAYKNLTYKQVRKIRFPE